MNVYLSFKVPVGLRNPVGLYFDWGLRRMQAKLIFTCQVWYFCVFACLIIQNFWITLPMVMFCYLLCHPIVLLAEFCVVSGPPLPPRFWAIFGPLPESVTWLGILPNPKTDTKKFRNLRHRKSQNRISALLISLESGKTCGDEILQFHWSINCFWISKIGSNECTKFQFLSVTKKSGRPSARPPARPPARAWHRLHEAIVRASLASLRLQ